MLKRNILILTILMMMAVPLRAELYFDGFLQGLYGGRLDDNNPTETEYTASETRLQMRAEHFSDVGEFFGRLDFVYDGADSARYDWELREGYMKFRLGQKIDFKIGRQILTWGTGDLIFINDVFAKDYRSFFIGRDDQYLKAPQSAVRMAVYPGFGDFSFVWTPRFEPNRLPTGERLSYYNPFVGRIVGEGYYFDPPRPAPKFKNGEFAFRYQHTIGNFNAALYFYKGFYKNPMGAVMTPDGPMAVYPRLNVYGASIRGMGLGGVLWVEGGYFDSRQDRNGDNPMMPNSSATAMVGYERQVATNLTANVQWQADVMMDYDTYKQQQTASGGYVRDEVRHLLTSRITRKLYQELVTVSAFVFYSPTDEDVYGRASVEYKYSDEVILTVGGNFFDGENPATEFGQFMFDDNVYVKATYGF